MDAVGLTKEETLALAAKCLRSPSEFCRIFLKEWFPTKMPWVHRGILAMRLRRTEFLLDFGKEKWRDEEGEWTHHDLEKILTNFIEEGSGKPIFDLSFDSEGNPKILLNVGDHAGVIMPRGFSKTTVMNAANLIDALYQQEDFFLYVSESGAHAERQLGTLKSELGGTAEDPDNAILQSVFGEHLPTRQSPLKNTENYLETTKGVQIGAVGRGGQIRGFSKRAKRPGIIIFDDIEDSESVQVETQRKKDSTWFFGTALPTKRKGGRIFIIGTLLHNDAILNKVIKSERFTCVRFGAVDRQGDALWPYMMDLEAIEKLKLDMAAEGELPSFYLEYMSVYKSDEAQMFPASKIVRIAKGLECFVGMALVCDPAISKAAGADFCAFAVAGIEKGGNKHCIDLFAKKGMDPAEQVEKFFELHEQWMVKIPAPFRRHGVEAIAYQQALVHLILGEQYSRSQKLGMDAYFEVTPIVHGKTGKEARVQGILKPLLYAGKLTFNGVFPELETQLTEWPNGKKDAPDVLAMAITLLDPFASLNTSLDFDPAAKLPPLSPRLVSGFRAAP